MLIHIFIASYHAGITQEKVDNAVLLIEALALFDQFIKEYFVARKVSYGEQRIRVQLAHHTSY